MSILRSYVPRIHPRGWPIISIFVAVAIGTTMLLPELGWIMFGLTGWCVWFFRDPDRVTPVRAGLVISPADGRICRVDQAAPPTELDMGSSAVARVSIFLSAFDVHVNRFPVDGTVKCLAYRPGLFINAAFDKASSDNERMAIRLDTDGGQSLAVVQIAGLVARRIITWTSEGEKALAGSRFGMIRFGSRCDLYLPAGVVPMVAEGQRAIAGETIIADLSSLEPVRQWIVR